MKRHLITILLSGALLTMGCQNKATKDNPSSTPQPSHTTPSESTPSPIDQRIPMTITAHFEGGRGINVTLDILRSTTTQPLMEAIADSNGTIHIQTTLPSEGPYQLRFPHGVVHLILKGGNLRVNGKIDRLAHFTAQGDGADETMAMYELYRLLERFNHQFRRLQRRSDQATATKDIDLVRQVLDSINYESYGITYRKHQEIVKFIQAHDTMLVAGIAAARIQLDVFFPYLRQVDSMLNARWPHAHLTHDLHQKYVSAYPYMPGKPAPVFTLTDLHNQQHSLTEFRGKYVLLDFWASWCEPCIKSFAHMKPWYHRWNGRGLEIIGISMDETKQKAQQAVQKHQIPWRILWAGDRSQVAIDYGVQGIPHYVIISPDGRIVSQMLRGRAIEYYFEEHI